VPEVETVGAARDVTTAAFCTREARLYAVKQLAQRAGVSRDFFWSWNIQYGDTETTVYVQPGTRKCVRFKNLASQYLANLQTKSWLTCRAKWMFAPSGPVQQAIPDFPVPFSFSNRENAFPLFRPIDRDTVLCELDLPLSGLLTLSRFEEIYTKEKDVHGRFSALMSIAYRDGFLNRPIVDEYGLAFEQALTYLLPSWQPRRRTLRVKLSHDIDTVGYPFHFRTVLGHVVHHHGFSVAARDLLGPLVRMRPVYLALVQAIAQYSLDCGLDSAVYWKASPASPQDIGYDPLRPEIQEVIRWLAEKGLENGVHPGYYTFLSPEQLQKEVWVLQRALGQQPLGGRQHYLRWSPETWVHWENSGLAYDSTVGYADGLGFRAGTCFPYRPWLLSANREARLIEIPLIIMDCVLTTLMRLTPEQTLQVIGEYIASCRLVGGVFTLLWHHDRLIEPTNIDTFEKVLEELAGQAGFDWKNSAEELY
jgi:hypothetical protein